MNIKITALLPLFFILLLASCKEEKKHVPLLPSPMEEIDTTNIKRSLLNEVKNFVNEHPTTKVFILYNIPLSKYRKGYGEGCIGCRTKFNNVYYIHEAADLHFGEGEFVIRNNYPHRYIGLNGKIVFVPSDDDRFYDQKKLKKIYDSTQLIIEDRQLAKHSFLLYDLKDSCSITEEPFIDDSLYEYRNDEIIYKVVEKVKSSIHFTIPEE